MIKARLSNGVAVLGLSEENIVRLKAGQPIKFDGTVIGFSGDVIIVYGATEPAIVADLAHQLGLSLQ